MKMMNLDDRQQVNEFIVEQMNSDYELETTYRLSQTLMEKDIKLELRKFDKDRFEKTLLNVLLKKRNENYDETFFIINVYTILKEVMRKYIFLNHFDELTELTLQAKIEYERIVEEEKGTTSKDAYKQYLEVYDNFFIFLPIEILSQITMIYVGLVNEVLDRNVDGVKKAKVVVRTKNINDLQQVPFSDSVLFRNEVEIMKKIQTMKDRKVKSFV
jgi:hypothetical protein